MSRFEEIAEKYGEDYILCQLAEECAELCQAALKLVRARNKTTPMRVDEATERLIEEIADVTVMLKAVYDTMFDAAMMDAVNDIHIEKVARMYERMLDGKMEEEVW